MQQATNKIKRPNIYDMGGFPKEVYSAKALATGNTKIILFDGKNEVFETNYATGGRNIFENGRGAINAVAIDIVMDGGASPDLSVDALRDALASFVRFGRIEITRNTLPVLKESFRRLISLPTVVKTAANTPISISGKLEPIYLPLRTPIAWESSNDNMEVICYSPAVGAGLDTGVLVGRLVTADLRPRKAK